MTTPRSTLRNADGSTVGSRERLRAHEEGRRVVERWEQAGEADLPAALAAHPDLLVDRSVFFDLVQKEFQLHREEWTGRPVREYCERFPDLSLDLLRSLRRLVEIEQCFGKVALDQVFRGADEVDWPSAGNQFGEFEVSHELGRGSAGRVFLCRQRTLGEREVVVKVSQTVGAEALTLGKLDHPNIVPVHATGVDQKSGLGWICMPYLGDRTLQDAIADTDKADAPEIDLLGQDLSRFRPVRRRERNQGVALRLFADLASGLSYLHQQGLLHGDLKPSNVLLTSRGVPMLIDFNLACAVAPDAMMLGGTLPYMAPEQLAAVAKQSSAHGLSTATDMFAFGVVLHQALTGELPFETPDSGKPLNEVAHSLFDAQTAWRSNGATTLARLDPAIARLIRDCLAESPNDRPDSFSDVRRRLNRLHSPAASSWRFVKHRPLSSAATTLLGVAVLAGVAWAAPLGPRAQLLRTTRQLAAENRHAESIELLRPHVVAHPTDADASRLLANALLDSGDPKNAAEHFMQAWRAANQPLDIAMVGYCYNRIGKHKPAITSYQQAEELGLESIAIQHNRAASLVISLARTFDAEISRQVALLLEHCWKAAPDNETIRLTMLRHFLMAAEQPERARPEYPAELADFPTSRPSFEFCQNAARFLALQSFSEPVLRRYGISCLERMAGLAGAESVRLELRRTPMAVYGPLLDDSPLNRPKPPRAPKPPEFLDPRLK